MLDHTNNHVFQYISKLIANKQFKSIVEIGCAAGNNLLGFKESGFIVKGFDFSKELVHLGNSEFDLDLEQGSFIDAVKQGYKYDVVILNHVLEHFTNIKTELNLLKRIINPDGLIYIGIPNIDNFSLTEIQNAHTYYFNPRTFRYYMNKYGFTVMNIEPVHNLHMHSVLQIGNQHCTDLTGEYDFMINKIRKRKRIEYIANKLEYFRLRKIIGYFYRYFTKRNNIH